VRKGFFRSRIPILACAFLPLVIPTPVTAQSAAAASSGTNKRTDSAAWKTDCSKMLHQPGKNTAKACATDTFTARPFHFLVQSVVPSSGYGGGGVYSRDLNHDVWQNQLKMTGVLTIRQYWFAQVDFTTRRPSFGGWNQGEENFALELYARNRQLPNLPFYGLGPNTNVNNSVQFSERDTRVGIHISNPLTTWLNAQGTIESLWPAIGGVSGRTIQTEYTELTAPGLISQPNFLHYELLLNPHGMLWDWLKLDYGIRYGYFQDTNTGHYSFRRLDADFKHELYPERVNGHRNLDSLITAEIRVSASNTSAGNAIPFYLQETIGGSDIDNKPTLRAFKDYRFQAPNLILFQGEFDRRVYGPFGLLLFYDAGKVALQRSDIDFSNFKQGAGGGLSFFLGDKIVFKAYVGLGGGEGAHAFFGIPSFLPQ
jgi:hypothetical protein